MTFEEANGIIESYNKEKDNILENEDKYCNALDSFDENNDYYNRDITNHICWKCLHYSMCLYKDIVKDPIYDPIYYCNHFVGD